MNTEERLQRLEALLDRVRRRATEARLPLTRLFDASRPQPRLEEPVPPPVREITPEPPAAARTPEPPAAARAPDSAPAFVPYTVVPATLELVDTPPPEALGEEDVLDEIPSDMLESVPPSGGVAAREAFDTTRDDEEEPPASSQRPRVDALLDAAPEALLDEEREVPLKTPPPESGPQEAPIPTGFGAPHLPDVDRLEADLSPAPATGSAGFDSLEPPFGAVSRTTPAAGGPTLEQLGQTIDLEEGGGGPSLELDAPATPPPPPPPKPEELEASLPARESAGRYHDELMPPPEAREELEAHLEKGEDSLSPAAAAPHAEEEVAPAALAPPVVTTEPAIAELPIAEFSRPAEPELVGRPPLESGVVFTVKPNDQPPLRPSTFLELLDSSIQLGG